MLENPELYPDELAYSWHFIMKLRFQQQPCIAWDDPVLKSG